MKTLILILVIVGITVVPVIEWPPCTLESTTCVA